MTISPVDSDFLKNLLSSQFAPGRNAMDQGAVSPSLPQTPGTVLPPVKQPRALTQQEYNSLRGSQTVSELLQGLTPKMQSSAQRHTGNAKWSALADVMGSAAGIYSATQGGPVQSPTMRHQQHLSMYEQLLQQYEQQKRAHDLMTVQNEIANLQGYGDYQLQQEQQAEKLRQQQEADYLKHGYDLDKIHQQYIFDMHKRGADHQANLDLQDLRNTGSAKVASIRAAGKGKGKDEGKDEERYPLYDQYGRIVDEIDPRDADKVAAYILNDIATGKIREEPGVAQNIRLKNLDGKELSAKERSDLITLYWQKSPGARAWLERKPPTPGNNKAAWAGTMVDRNQVISEMRKRYPNLTDQQIRAAVNQYEKSLTQGRR